MRKFFWPGRRRVGTAQPQVPAVRTRPGSARLRGHVDALATRHDDVASRDIEPAMLAALAFHHINGADREGFRQSVSSRLSRWTHDPLRMCGSLAATGRTIRSSEDSFVTARKRWTIVDKSTPNVRGSRLARWRRTC